MNSTNVGHGGLCRFRPHPFAQFVAGVFVAGLFSGPVQALPDGAQVSAGNIATSRSGSQLTIDQASDKAAINWLSFGIATGESVRFNQPGPSSIVLNRVLGPDLSLIQGALSSNGQVFLLNPNGVLFAQGAQVNVGGIVASSLSLSDADFLAGRYLLGKGAAAGSVVNKGTINASDGGYVALVAPQVQNEGLVSARLGMVALAAGEQVTLNLNGNSLVSLAVDRGAIDALLDNRNLISADGGNVVLTARAADGLTRSVVNNRGIVQANSLASSHGVIRLEGGDIGNNGSLRAAGGGRIVLAAQADVTLGVGSVVDAGGDNGGAITVQARSGTLLAQGRVQAVGASGTGGTIALLGDHVGVLEQASVDASGRTGGGTVLIGGDRLGANPDVQNAARTVIASRATVHADATDIGDGGKVIVWSQEYTSFQGAVSARGGAGGGNGGFVETSSRALLEATGTVDTLAPLGQAGLWLLDPTNMTITTAGQANVSPSSPFSPTASGSVLTWTTINNGLLGGNVSVLTTTGFGAGQPGNITISGAGSLVSANSLTLTAAGDIAINATITGTGGGTLAFNGVNISSSAAITTTGAANKAGGSVTINASGTVNLGAAITANGGAGGVSLPGSNAGNVTVSGAGVTTAAITATGGAGGTGSQPGGAGGAVLITSTGGVTTAAIAANGGNATTTNGNGGHAGTITIDNSTAGNIGTTTLSAVTGTATGTGTGGNAGSISLANTAGNIATTSISTTGGIGGRGGNIALNASGTLTSTLAITASGGTALANTAGNAAGNITLTGAGITTAGITATGTAGGTALSSQPGGAGGAVLITSTGGVTTAAIAANGGNATTTNGNGGDAGTITINNSTAGDIGTTTLSAVTGLATGTGSGGNAGGIALANTAGNIATTSITTTGGAGGRGGNIALNASGTLTSTLAITATGGAGVPSAAGNAAGNVTLTGAGVTTAGITATGGNASTSLSSQNGGAGGAVRITSIGGVSTGAITANGGNATTTNGNGGDGGTITINNSTAGNIGTAALQAVTGTATGTGLGGTAGRISLGNSAGNVATSGIDTSGGVSGNGGDITLTATGAVSTLANSLIDARGGAIAIGGSAQGTDGGNVTIIGSAVAMTRSATANSLIIASGGNALNLHDARGGHSGTISVTATGGAVDFTLGNLIASGGNAVAGVGAGGNAGDITINAPGNVTANNITTRNGVAVGTGAAGGAARTLQVGGANLSLGVITTTGNSNGAGGAVNLSASGTLSTGAIVTSGGVGTADTAAGNAGSVTLIGAGASVSLGAITAGGGNAGAGAAAGGTGGAVTIRGVDRTLSGAVLATGGSAGLAGAPAGNGGTILITGTDGTIATAGTLSTQAITATGGAGTVADAAGGNGGSITLHSQGGLTVLGLSSSGGAAGAGGNSAGGNAGALMLRNTDSGDMVTGALAASAGVAAGTGNGGNAASITLDNAAGNISTLAITANGSNGGGSGNAAGGSAGAVTLTAGGLTPAITLGGNVSALGGDAFGAGAPGTGARIWLKSPTLLNAANLAISAADVQFDSTLGAGANAVLVSGNTITFGGGNGSVSGTAGILLQPIADNVSVGIAGAAGTLQLSQAAIDSLAGTFSGITIGRAGGSATTSVDAVTFAMPVLIRQGGIGGAVQLDGTVTGTGGASVAVSAPGGITFNGAGITTADQNITLGGPVSLATGTVTFASGAGNLSFNGTVDGAQALTINNTGTTTFASTVGQTTPLTSLTTSVGGSVQLLGSAIATNGNQTYNGSLVTVGPATLSTTANGAIQASGPVSATAGLLTLATGTGDVVLNNAANDFVSVRVAGAGAVSVVDANALVLGPVTAGSVSARTLTGNITLAGDIAVTGAGDSIVLASGGDFLNPGASALDPGAGRWLVWSADPANDARGGLAYAFKQYNASLGDTVLGSGNGFLYSLAPTITPSLTDAVSGAISKVYDGTDGATLLAGHYAISGAVDGDKFTLSNLTASYDSRNVGTSRNVAATGITIAGATDSGGTLPVYGYRLASTTANADIGTILAKALTGSVTAGDKAYDATDAATIATRTLSGVLGADTVNYVGGSAIFDDKNAGTAKAVTASGLSLSGADAGNYTVNTVASTTANVLARDLTIRADDKTRPANTANPPFTATYAGFAPGEGVGDLAGLLVLGSVATVDAIAGSYAIVPSNQTNVNYAIVFVNGVLTVTPGGLAGPVAPVTPALEAAYQASLATASQQPRGADEAQPLPDAGIVAEQSRKRRVRALVAIRDTGIRLPTGLVPH